jgi:hypothetical protein
MTFLKNKQNPKSKIPKNQELGASACHPGIKT